VLLLAHADLLLLPPQVLESRGKAVLTLAKPPRKSTFDEVTEWPALHFGAGAAQGCGCGPAAGAVTWVGEGGLIRLWHPNACV
jgi:hypothetical protein